MLHYHFEGSESTSESTSAFRASELKVSIAQVLNQLDINRRRASTSGHTGCSFVASIRKFLPLLGFKHLHDGGLQEDIEEKGENSGVQRFVYR